MQVIIFKKEVHNGSNNIVPPETLNLSMSKKEKDNYKKQQELYYKEMFYHKYIEDGYAPFEAKEKSDTIKVYLSYKELNK